MLQPHRAARSTSAAPSAVGGVHGSVPVLGRGARFKRRWLLLPRPAHQAVHAVSPLTPSHARPA